MVITRFENYGGWHCGIYSQTLLGTHRVQTSLQNLAYLQSWQLVTPCLLLLVLICSVINVTSVSTDSEDFTYIIDDDDCTNISQQPCKLNHKNMLQIREEMLLHYGYTENMKVVEKRAGLSVNEFWDLYDAKWPVIVTDIVPGWNAYQKWSKEFFLENYGAERVVLKVVQGTLKEAVAYVEDIKTFIDRLEQDSSYTSWTYLEDEIFLLMHPELRQDIGSNHLMEENFFNLFPTEIQPWDCMLLWGTRYSRSSLHVDPYNWTAISAVIWGRKRWKLCPPRQDQYLHIRLNQTCGFPLECTKYNSEVDAFDVNYQNFPKFRNAEYIEVEQQGGEMLIIPSGWFHQAFNEEETLSVSMQVMNHNNYLVVLEEIIKGLNVNRNQLPAHFQKLLPTEQVKLFMTLLPEKVLRHGREVTETVLNHMNVIHTMKDKV